MAKYFVSFSSTFESLLDGKLVPTDLCDGFLVFGCRRSHVLLPYDQVPIEVLLSNRIKPKQQPDGTSTVHRKLVDNDVLDMWDHFAAQIRKANLEKRLIFMHKIGHPSYRHFCRDMAAKGDSVFWKGFWVKCDEPAIARQPEPVYSLEHDLVQSLHDSTVPMPDDAFIDSIIAEQASTASLHGYTHG